MSFIDKTSKNNFIVSLSERRKKSEIGESCFVRLGEDVYERICLERLASITKSTYFFIQKLYNNKFLDLDNDEYARNYHRNRTRVDANAAALELLGLSCDDEQGRFLSHARASLLLSYTLNRYS